MSFASGYAFQTNGQIGSQYTATINTALAGTSIGTSANIAYFSSLPIGVYSISVQFKVDVTINAPTYTQYYWDVGISSSPTGLSLYPATTIGAPNSNINVLVNPNVPINANFIISVTNSNPIYINNIIYSTSANAIFFDNPFTPTCIAIKLA